MDARNPDLVSEARRSSTAGRTVAGSVPLRFARTPSVFPLSVVPFTDRPFIGSHEALRSLLAARIRAVCEHPFASAQRIIFVLHVASIGMRGHIQREINRMAYPDVCRAVIFFFPFLLLPYR